MNLPCAKNNLPILIAEDDPDDRLLLKEAFRASQTPYEIHFVEDGEELMDYLLRRGKYSAGDLAPRPALILLDLNMPKKDGRQALREIKADPDLIEIPVVVWTTSGLEEDRIRCRDFGAEDYLIKPSSFAEVEKAARELVNNWLEPSVRKNGEDRPPC